MSQPDQFLDTGRQILTLEIQGLEAVRHSLDSRFSRAAACLAACQGQIVLTGLGKSGLIARKMAATFSSIGAPAIFLHPVEALHGDLGLVREHDVVIALSNSGETEELLCLMPELARIGCKSIAVTASLDSSLARAVDFPIPVKVPREACLLNLTPTASTTAALAVGDALAACLVQARRFDEKDFRKRHPGGALGRRLALKVEHIMLSENLPTVSPDATTREAVDRMDTGGYGIVFCLEENKRLVGVLTDGDVRRGLARGVLDMEKPVRHYATEAPRRIPQGASVARAMDIMEQHAITALPVVDDQNALQGLVHIHDILGRGKINFSGP